MTDKRFTWDDWNALSPERRDEIQKEAAAMEDPDSIWGRPRKNDDASEDDD